MQKKIIISMNLRPLNDFRHVECDGCGNGIIFEGSEGKCSEVSSFARFGRIEVTCYDTTFPHWL